MSDIPDMPDMPYQDLPDWRSMVEGDWRSLIEGGSFPDLSGDLLRTLLVQVINMMDMYDAKDRALLSRAVEHLEHRYGHIVDE